MKRKYWIEAGVAAVVLLILLLVLIPNFMNAQMKTQMALMAQCVDDLVKYVAANGTARLKEPMKLSPQQWNSVRFYHPPSYNSQLTTRTNYIVFDPYYFSDQVKSIQQAQWKDSMWNLVYVSGDAELDAKKITNQHSNSEPLFFSFRSIVGSFDYRKFYEGISLDIDPQGNLFIKEEPVVPYDTTNGLSSYGEWYKSSEEFWPLPNMTELKKEPE
ncbi:hypothetical protein K8I31_22285 [bacterium]|nr:hypothetical protein [bacterium]